MFFRLKWSGFFKKPPGIGRSREISFSRAAVVRVAFVAHTADLPPAMSFGVPLLPLSLLFRFFLFDGGLLPFLHRLLLGRLFLGGLSCRS